jgi:hypothetical protein
MRETIAYAEHTRIPTCILIFDFAQAFDRISHSYLFKLLPRYGLSQWFIDRLYTLHETAEARLQLNGTMSGNIAIKSGIRQGCPLSTILYALALQPLLNTLRERLPAIAIGRYSQHSPAIAYVDDLIVFVTRPEDLDIVKEAIHTYENASGAIMNPAKSTALPIGTWTHEPSILGIPLSDHVKILGLEFASTMALSTALSWARVTNAIRAQASSMYDRTLDFTHRMQFIMQYLLAKLWYTAQVFTATRAQTHRLTTICM